ncbi:Ubiquitin- modifier 1 [Coemansia erecta]|uniref:Ubiquitin-related modifier 1 n=1 Tax=Coemansia asiatica TaxID=1052880 RepID=A0A9W8CKR9_9FUNG|nr:Ubiquitin- modifier 1 [Coemansia asiatica]KAJ2854418.1 Ubiquitin- modifier 1 [Coemansia erecta]
MEDLKLTLKFSSGAELMIKDEIRADAGTKTGDLELTRTLPATTDGKPTIAKDLLEFIRDNLIKDRQEDFYDKEKLRPGILVIINGSDWEVEDGPEYRLQNNDTVEFISTLHGG